ncbi:hypothetical protein F2Q68_00015683 [Brassica cretica]|uniref:Uncharacterized protein n=2 Tax=Brassica cretica TaxID=69181 RepID=A0A8S9HMA9_BRACR|nr:hypothetical protein F2Q68_00015683 [Brassica cretica]KAF3612108.1 hypothetical protein DY000_02048274 [Brassica cretica]
MFGPEVIGEPGSFPLGPETVFGTPEGPGGSSSDPEIFTWNPEAIWEPEGIEFLQTPGRTPASGSLLGGTSVPRYEVLRSLTDEDLKSVAGPPAHKINHTSYIGASSDIGASKEGYLYDHEEFGRETTSYRFSTQPEHAVNWFHTKRSSGLGDTLFTSQATYTASERSSGLGDTPFIDLIKAGSYSVSSNSMTVLTHLSSVQKVENISGTNMEIKEQEPNLAVQASPRLEIFQVPTNDKVISELNVNSPTYQNTGMMHLHSIHNVDEGLGKEEPRPEAHQPEVYEQYTIETFSPADHALKMTKTKAESMQDAMSDNRVSIGTMEKNPALNSKSYTQRVVENISGTNMEIKEQEPSLAVQASPRLEMFQVPTNDKVISELNVNNPPYQNTGMMHLHSVQNVDEGLGKEEPRPEAHQPEVYEEYTI